MKVSYFSCCSGVLAPLLLLSGSVTHAQSVGGKNIGGRLKHLLEATEGRSVTRDLSRSHLTYNSLSRRYELGSGKRNILVDDQNRILVRFVLDSGTTSEAMEERLSRAGGTLVARNQQFHNRVISAYLPIEQVRFSATLPGVKAVHLESPPVLNSGAVTSQGVRALNVDKVLSAGYDGEGVTVGILSDSYNNTAAAGNPDTALYDVQTGDLPGTTAIPGKKV